MVNIRSKIGQQRQYLMMIRIMTNIERKFAKRIEVILKKRYNSASEAVRTGNLRLAVDKMGLYSDDLRKIFENFYIVTASTFGELFFRSWKASEKSLEEGIERAVSNILEVEFKGFTEETFYERMRRWAKEEAGNKIKIINKTEADKVGEFIEHMIEDGESHVTIAKGISAFEEMSLWEALRISRTETHTCANASTQEAAKSTGVEWNKYWVTANDERVRESHAQAAIDYSSENAIPMDEMYEVGESELMYPGDPGGEPEDVINCRCVELYVAAEQGNTEEAA